MPGQGHGTLFGKFSVAKLCHPAMATSIQGCVIAKMGKPPRFPDPPSRVVGCVLMRGTAATVRHHDRRPKPR